MPLVLVLTILLSFSHTHADNLKRLDRLLRESNVKTPIGRHGISNMENIHVFFFTRAFDESGIVFDRTDFIRMVKESNILLSAGLDMTIPFKSAGLDSTNVIDTLRRINTAIYLVDSGIPLMTAISSIDYSKNKTSWGLIGASFALAFGLEAGGHEVSIYTVVEALKAAHALVSSDMSPDSAYKSFGIDISTIPVDKEKYRSLMYMDSQNKDDLDVWDDTMFLRGIHLNTLEK